MKRFIIILTLVMTSVVCNAQISYIPTDYSRHSTQAQQHQQQQVQTYSTTAYYQSGNGYVKLPIRVKVQDGRIIPVMYYQQTMVGGQWCNFSSGLIAQKCCISMFSDLLESQFMYKCSIVNPEVTTIYFDL